MKIDLKKLTGTNLIRLPFSETLDLRQETLYGAKPFQSPVYSSGEITNDSGVLRLKGNVRAIYSTACARCLKPLEIPLSADVDTILTADPDAEEEDDLFVMPNGNADTADIMIPALLLQVQMVYLCREDCKGICPHCGVNRNEIECHCENRQIDSRFAALRALLNSSPEQEIK